MTQPPTSRKDQTKQALIHALALELLSSERLAVERVADRAKINKALVYRYFGGLPGLIRAFAEGDGFLPNVRDLLAHVTPAEMAADARHRFAALIKAYIRELSKRPPTVQILLRFHLFDPEVVEAIHAGRARAIEEIRGAFGEADATATFDLDLAFNILISGACQLLGQRRDGRLPAADELEALGERLTLMIDGLLLIPPPASGPIGEKGIDPGSAEP